MFEGGNSITQITEYDAGFNLEDLLESSAGQTSPQFSGASVANPAFNFGTRQVGELLSKIDDGGIMVDLSGGNVDVEYKRGASHGLRVADATASHMRARMEDNALMFWSGLSASQGQPAEIKANILPVWDGSNDPLVFTGSVALSATSQAAENFTNQIDPGPVLAAIAEHVDRGGNVGWAIPPGVLVLDADNEESAAWVAETFPDAPRQRTRNGCHVVVKEPKGIDLRQVTQLEIVDGITVDLRTSGKGQIAVEPSIHPSGFAYHWEVELPLDLATLPEIPPVLVERLRTKEEAQGPVDISAASWREGSRETRLVSMAGRLRNTNSALADAVFLDVTGRTAKRLLELAGEADEFALPITPEELAGMVGASRERFNKAIASFVKLRWIEQQDRRYRITNREELERRAR